MSFFETGGGDSSGGGGDIWSTGAFSFESPLKDLLDSGSFTLEDLLGEDELLQELRGMHPQLVDFFAVEGVVEGLVRYMIQEKPSLDEVLAAEETKAAAPVAPDDDAAEEEKRPIGDDDEADGAAAADASGGEAINEPGRWMFGSPDRPPRRPPTQEERDMYELRYVRYPYMACEVVCCEVEGILDALVSGVVGDGTEGGAAGGAADGEAMMEEIALSSSADEDENGGSNKASGPSLELELSASEEADAREASGVAAAEEGKDPDGAEDERPKPEMKSLMDLLFTVLTETPALTLDDRRAGYLEKVLSVLFRRRPQALTSYLGGDILSSASCGKGGEECKDEEEGRSNDGDENRAAELMAAFFQQMHSHSIMQIAQRLLMPPPPGYAAARRASMMNAEKNGDGNGKNGQGNGGLEGGLMGGNGWPNMMGDMDADMDADLDHGESILDDDEDPTGMGGMLAVRAEWSYRPEAVEFLLSHLIGDSAFPTLPEARPRGVEDDWEANEARLDASRHASDVLVSVVQNSTLDAGAVRALTSDPILGRIIEAIRGAAPATDDGAEAKEHAEVFGPHESRATTAMSVLESLVLQLGGYGAVGGAAAAGGDEFGDEMGGCGGMGDTQAAVGGEGKTPEGCEPEMGADAADVSALMAHLPPLLSSLAALLTHPSASGWTSSAQYSRKPSLLLGTSRLRVVRLLESLVLLGDARVDALLAQSDALSHCLDLFWSFPWCSMLHQSVANLLVHVLEGGDARGELQEYFLCRCNLVGRLVDSFGDSGIDGAGTEGCKASSPVPEPEGGSSHDVIMDGKLVAGGGASASTPLGDAAATLADDLKAIAGSTADGDAASTPAEDAAAETADKTGPRYSEMMFALKTYRSNQSTTSSVESERGSSVASSSSSDEEDENEEEEERRRRAKDLEGETIPVSDDDVDAAMENEGLESGASSATTDATATKSKDDDAAVAVTPEANTPSEGEDADMAEDADAKSGDAMDAAPEPAEALSSEGDDSKEKEEDEGPPFRMGYMGHIIIICQALVHACNATDEEGDGEGEVGPDGGVGREPLDDTRSRDSFDAEVELAVLPHLNGEGPSDIEDNEPPPKDDKDEQSEEKEAEGEEEEEAESRKRKDRPSPEADDVKREGKKNLSVEEARDALARTSLEPEPLSSEEEGPSMATPTESEETLEDIDVEQPLAPPAYSRRPCIVRLMHNHPLYSRWQSFVTTTLASETAVQSTPLGGYASAQGQDDGFGGLAMGMCGDMQSPGTLSEGEFLGEEGAVLAGDEGADASAAADAAGVGVVGGMNVSGGIGFIGPGGGGAPGVVAGSIDLDDADLDIAASMMEALSLPPSSANGASKEDGNSGHGHHVRGQHRIIGGGSAVASFGSVVQMPKEGGAQYVYDDPLGAGRNPGFDDGDDDSDGEEGGALEQPSGGNTEEQVEGDGTEVSGGEGGEDEGSSEEDKDDEDVPVIDLFAGNFSFQEASAGDGAAGETKASDDEDNAVNSDEAGWANFANFDDAFAASALPEPTPMAPDTASPSDASRNAKDTDATAEPSSEVDTEGADDNLFGDTPHLVDALANDDELDNDAAPPDVARQDDGRI